MHFCYTQKSVEQINEFGSSEGEKEKKKEITYDPFTIPNWHTTDKTVQPAQLC